MQSASLEQPYKGFMILGSAEAVHNNSPCWFAAACVMVIRPDNVCIVAYRFQDSLLTYDDEDLSKWFGLFLAQIAIDHCLPPPAYYLTPMNIAWAVDILRRAADECKIREIRRPKLYEALDFLEQSVEPRWLVRRYRRELSGDRRNDREKEELREALRITTRGIQQACAALLVDKMNELAVRFREHKPEIDNLRWQLGVVRRPVQR